MPDLPTGTVTFLFTDIEGSTRLWEQHPEQMKLAHARHGELIVSCVQRHGGTFVRIRGEGDSTFSVFSTAADALAAACAFQRALASGPWPVETPIRVRAALHTGTANLRDEDYNSSDVNRCARLRAIAHGGQTIVSQTVYDLAKERLQEGVTLKDMGLHRLKDLSSPEHVWQLCHPDLPTDFPPLNSLTRAVTNLPIQPTSFIGREREMEQVKRLLEGTHLLTLTGSGGCGKTRLALQVAADLVEEYADGVWLVELAPLSNPDLVPQSIASALGLREEPGRSLTETLTDYLKPKTLLLALDNCEHLVEACARLADTLLRSCPQVKILATSREALNIGGETIYRVPSLLNPDPHALPLEEKELSAVLLDYDAVRLFVERARSHRSDFALTRQNGSAVAEVCYRLDGIPLAIELAAARVRAMSAAQITARLDDRFKLLTGGSRMAPTRQQTLKAALDWSYDLLTEPERLLLRRLSVFAGGWTLEAAEFVCSTDQAKGEREKEKGKVLQVQFLSHDEVLDLLTSLMDKSLVVFNEDMSDEGRYRLLETVRQYGYERLAETEEEAVFRDRQLDYFLVLAEKASPKLKGAEQEVWLKRLEADHDNLRTALDWCRQEADGAEIGLRLAGALWKFWEAHGYLSEGRQYLEKALAGEGAAGRTQARARVLHGAGALAWNQGDYGAAKALLEESLVIFRELENKSGIAAALNCLGLVAWNQGDYGAARTLYQESLMIQRELGSKWGISIALNNLGLVTWNQGDYVAAKILFEEGLAIGRELGDKWGVADTLGNLGIVTSELGNYALAHSYYEESLAIHRELGDKKGTASSLLSLGVESHKNKNYAAARALFEESLALKRELGDNLGIAIALVNMGPLACAQNDYAAARTFLLECLMLLRTLGAKRVICYALEGCAELARSQQQMERAVRLWGAAESLREAIGSPLPPNEREEHKRALAAVREALDEKAFTAASAAGRAMTLEQAIEYALQEGER